MSPHRIVVALGGNAFVRPGRPLTMEGQFVFAKAALSALAPLFDDQTEVLLCHGNGPQVGHMLIRVEHALGDAYRLPLEVCVAESEGELGYVLQQTLHNLLRARNDPRCVVSVLTQVVVDPADPAFEAPSKPIGPFYDAARADVLRAQGFHMIEDAGRGFRRVVASPKPLAVVELPVLAQLLLQKTFVIAAGGGGIAVIQTKNGLRGVEAVVDKDRVAALLADRLDATRLVILTGVDAAYLDFETPSARPIDRMTPQQARGYLSDGHFAPGSMGPKVEAAARFVDRSERQALITDPRHLADAWAGRAGTHIVHPPKEAL